MARSRFAFASSPFLRTSAERSQWVTGTIAPLCARATRRATVVPCTVRRVPRMLLDGLADGMSGAVRRLRGVDRLSEKNVKAPLNEVKRAMLDADVNLGVVNDLLKRVRVAVVGAKVPPGIEPGQFLVKIMHDELASVMGGGRAELKQKSDGTPTIVLLAGLQGAGKTTAAAKLALHCKNAGRSVALVAADVHRPAATEQLRTLGERVGVEVYGGGTDARVIVRDALKATREAKVDTVIVDTAGRQTIDDVLMKELQDIKQISKADDTLLVVDAMAGQEAATVAKSFNEAVGVTGCVLTKLDGDTRGGAALSVQFVSGAPIKFVGVGERIDALEPFYPERMASRILGMGDVLTLVEKAQQAFDEKEAQRLTSKMMDRTFDFDDFLKQTKAVSKMGSLGGLMKMMPGVGAQLSEEKIALAEVKLKVVDSLIKSMTPKERKQPELLFADSSANSRLSRIASGAGRSDREARDLISDFQRMRTMMARMSKQMLGNGANGDPMAMGSPKQNRATRRRAAKKKAVRGERRGFG